MAARALEASPEERHLAAMESTLSVPRFISFPRRFLDRPSCTKSTRDPRIQLPVDEARSIWFVSSQ